MTSETLREHGREPDVEAARHDIDGLLAAIVADAPGARGSGRPAAEEVRCRTSCVFARG